MVFDEDYRNRKMKTGSVNISLIRNKVFPWYCKDNVYAKGYLFTGDGRLLKNEEVCDYFNDISDENEFKKKLLEANGLFSVVVNNGETWFLAVDRFRSFPLFYRQYNGTVYVGDEVDNVFTEGERKELDENSAIVYSGLSYVLGNKTLIANVHQMQAGECLIVSNGHISSNFYHVFLSEIRNDISFAEAKEELKKIINRVTEKMSVLLENRPVLLSLSGGLDSRLLAYMLKKAGKKDVLCYTFGRKQGNPEWEYSQKVADRLGFEWLFIDYTKIEALDFYTKNQFINFYKYESQYVSKFGFMQYFAADYLLNHAKINSTACVLQGHGGDFFSGSHLRSYMRNYRSLKTLAKDLQYIHCNIVKLSMKDRRIIRKEIGRELSDNFSAPLFGMVENWDLKERQAKYIINTNKLWEQFGVEVQMPLCDVELMNFFVSLPFEYRVGQKLYKEVLWELFDEYDLNFSKDRVNLLEVPWKENLKVFVKRLFPWLRKSGLVFQYDYFDYERFVQPIVKELKGNSRAIISMNGVFSEWYLLQVKKEIASTEKEYQ